MPRLFKHKNPSLSKSNSFDCINCHKQVSFKAPGTHHRNHCPYCLFSKHVDKVPGDRKEPCHGAMRPVGKMFKAAGEEMLVHECVVCGLKRKNRVAGDDSEMLISTLELMTQV